VPNTGTYTWTVPTSIPSNSYSIQITDSSGATNYSPFVQITGGSASASGSSVSGTASATGSASSGLSTSTSKASTLTSTGSKTTTSGSKTATATATATGSQAVPSNDAGRVGAGTGFAAVVGLGALVAIV
jgi:hypothetical protein